MIMMLTYRKMAREIPIERFARVANPSSYFRLAVAQLSWIDSNLYDGP